MYSSGVLEDIAWRVWGFLCRTEPVKYLFPDLDHMYLVMLWRRPVHELPSGNIEVGVPIPESSVVG